MVMPERKRTDPNRSNIGDKHLSPFTGGVVDDTEEVGFVDHFGFRAVTKLVTNYFAQLTEFVHSFVFAAKAVVIAAIFTLCIILKCNSHFLVLDFVHYELCIMNYALCILLWCQISRLLKAFCHRM